MNLTSHAGGVIEDASLLADAVSLLTELVHPTKPPAARAPLHIGIVACSSEGAALCYRTLCLEAAALLGQAHAHPEISMHSPSLSLYTARLDELDWDGVGELMMASALKLARGGAQLLICPDNTIHRALTPDLMARSPRFWLRIDEAVAAAAAQRGFKRVLILGTRWLVGSQVYPSALAARGIEFIRPTMQEADRCNVIIMDELCCGNTSNKESLAFLQSLIRRVKEEQEADAVVLGCTELPLVLSDANCCLPTLDSCRILARAALKHAIDTPAGKPSSASSSSSSSSAADRAS